ncbi:MAG: sodium:solute symporter [Ignavibacteria bacterium]|jgi:Na+/proline symporter|nr:sodium:solute symporter [Ignavibacteria bacterium]MCU7504706.1 sodium:solute symporter [Ignavibacteria bacterium]MCU7516308.1 sodium:solute symporter [Ignavibacteria bacterium]
MQLIDYSIVALYMAGVIGLGFYFERKASKGIDSYFLGDRNLPWWALGASGMASNVDLSGTMIIVGLLYALGSKGFFIEFRGGIVLIMAFFMVFMGKWNRRAKVMTVAEWMQFRFGKGKEGDVARILSASANIVFAVGAISYFAIGGGKFFGEFFGIDESTGTIILILITTIYTVASGLYGVVWTDVFQGFLILAAVVAMCFIAYSTVKLPNEFMVSVPLGKGGFQQLKTTFNDWSSILPPMKMNLPGDYSVFNLLGLTILLYMVKTALEGSGGSGGYITQRYFAAKSDREAGLLSLFWIFLLSFRWPLVTAFAILGIYHGISGHIIQDPELVVPVVIKEYVPAGVKGLIITGFLAAAMSTFTAIINAGAAYWVKDIFQAYLKPGASEKQLVLHSRLASVLIVVLGVAFSYNISSINEIWGWLSLGLGAGLAIPLVFRWFWWRFNGYGFATGTFFGMVTAILVKLLLPGAPEYISFIIPAGTSFIGCILGTLMTRPTEMKVLQEFYNVTRPFGFWGPVSEKLPEKKLRGIKRENRRDIISTFIAIPWQVAFFMMGMMLMMKNWGNFMLLLAVFAVLSAGLYMSWFKGLSSGKKKGIPEKGTAVPAESLQAD